LGNVEDDGGGSLGRFREQEPSRPFQRGTENLFRAGDFVLRLGLGAAKRRGLENSDAGVVIMAIELSDLAKVGFGAFIAVGTKWVDELRTRRNRKRAVATALLHELRGIEVNARQAASHATPGASGASVPTSLFHRVAGGDDLFLFRPTSIAVILTLDSLLKDIEDALQRYHSRPGGAWEIESTIRSKAFFVSEEIASVKAALVSERGAIPPPVELQTVNANRLPPLGDPAFPEWSETRNR
jgi:hypothetical protein